MNKVIVRESVVGITRRNGTGPNGAIVVYAESWKEGKTTIARAINEDGTDGPEYYATVVKFEHETKDPLYVAQFPVMTPGSYKVMDPGATYSHKKVTVFPGNVSEVSFT